MDMDQDKRSEFCSILYDLSKDQSTLGNDETKQEFYDRLRYLYKGKCGNTNFRHFYSDIFTTLTNIKSDAEKGNIEILSQNLEILVNDYKPTHNADDISNNLRKLYDHVNLDVARLSYIEKTDNAVLGEDQINNLRADITALQDKVNKAEKAQEEASNKLSSVQSEIIAVLSIFAAIILAFSGGLTFVGNLLSSLNELDIFKAILFLILSGFLLFNAIYILMYFVGKLTGKADCFDSPKKKSVITWFNLTLAIFLIIDIILLILNNMCHFIS